MSYIKQHARLATTTLAGLACLVSSTLLGSRITPGAAANPAQAQRYKTVDIDRQTRMDPVSIERISVDGQVIHPGVSTAAGREVKPGTEFEADEDWLRNMSVVLKNRTDKVIVRAEITLWFPETGDGSRSQIITSYTMALGQRPEIDSFTRHGQKLQPQPDKPPILLAPGQTLVIQAADYIDDIQNMLDEFPGIIAGKPPLAQVTKVAINGRQFYFADGMRWTDLDGFAVPDPNHPGQFTNLDRGHYFPGKPSQNWPPADAPAEVPFTVQPR